MRNKEFGLKDTMENITKYLNKHYSYIEEPKKKYKLHPVLKKALENTMEMITLDTQDIKITLNYNPWFHPIKWFRDKKNLKLANQLLNTQWNKFGMREKVTKHIREIIMYGSTKIKK